MKADLRFNKRAAPQVDANYTDASYVQRSDSEHPIRIKVYGGYGEGDWNLHMNPLEAHRLVQQINDALMKWAYAQIKRSQGDSK